MQLAKGIRLLDEKVGTGRPAQKGDLVIYNARIFLNKGDEVTHDQRSIDMYGLNGRIRSVDGRRLIDHSTVLGRRQPIAGIEKSLIGMRAGGYREVRVGAHLAYGKKGVADLIPSNAVLRIRLWLHSVQRGA